MLSALSNSLLRATDMRYAWFQASAAM